MSCHDGITCAFHNDFVIYGVQFFLESNKFFPNFSVKWIDNIVDRICP